MKKTILIISMLIFVLAACQTATPNIPVGLTASAFTYPTNTLPPPLYTQTPYPTYTQAPTQTPYVIVVTATSPPTPIYTPTKTLIPSPTVERTDTKDKVEGVYLVGNEVAPGMWRASGDCYAVLEDKAGKQIKMASGNRSIIAVTSNAYTVKFVSYPGKCTWSYLGP